METVPPAPSADRAAKIQLLLALEEKQRRHKRAPLIYHKPHPRQLEFHEAVSKFRYTIVTSANRWGKTTAGAAESLAHSLGYRPWEVPGLKPTADGNYPPRHQVPPRHWIRRADGAPLRFPNTGLIITGLKLMNGILMVVWPKLEEMLPQAVLRSPNLHVTKGPNGVPVHVKLPWGSDIWFASGEQSPKQLEASALDWAWCDEPFPRAFWIPLQRGLIDNMGRCWMTMTAVSPEAPWVKQDLVDNEAFIGKIAHITGSQYDNPYLTDAARKEFEDQPHPEEERVARIHGGWAFSTYAAFPGFDPAAHIMAPIEIPRDWPRVLAVDPAHRRPYAMVWIARGPAGEAYVYDEWPNEPHHQMRSSGKSVRDYVGIITQKEAGKPPVNLRVLDPRFGVAQYTVHGEVEQSIQEMLSEAGMNFDCDIEGTGREETGIELIRDMMRWDVKSPLGPLNRPKLRVFEGCLNTILALKNSTFAPPNARDPAVLPEKLRETFKDFRDALRYGLLAGVPILQPRSQGYISVEDLRSWNEGD